MRTSKPRSTDMDVESQRKASERLLFGRGRLDKLRGDDLLRLVLSLGSKDYGFVLLQPGENFIARGGLHPQGDRSLLNPVAPIHHEDRSLSFSGCLHRLNRNYQYIRGGVKRDFRGGVHSRNEF